MKDEGSSSKSGPMASLIKLRRRLTVGGATETVDGVSKQSAAEDDNKKVRIFEGYCVKKSWRGI